MNLTRVTITGADDRTIPADLIALSQRFPWVEWGVLVSERNEGTPRFPTRGWVDAFLREATRRGSHVYLALHICGRWVRALTSGSNAIELAWPGIFRGFDRIQLNTHGSPHAIRPDRVAAFMRTAAPFRQVIIQMDGTDNENALPAYRASGLDAVPLFDRSGGAGRVPDAWPAPLAGMPLHGYAGGLGPETLPRELPRIAAVAREHPVWIDMESAVRIHERLDLRKVEQCLQLCSAWIAGIPPLRQ